jgi:hypothetical protein
MSECVACKYSGRDEAEYRAHGCPACVCPPKQAAGSVEPEVNERHAEKNNQRSDAGHFQDEVPIHAAGDSRKSDAKQAAEGGREWLASRRGEATILDPRHHKDVGDFTAHVIEYAAFLRVVEERDAEKEMFAIMKQNRDDVWADLCAAIKERDEARASLKFLEENRITRLNVLLEDSRAEVERLKNQVIEMDAEHQVSINGLAGRMGGQLDRAKAALSDFEIEIPLKLRPRLREIIASLEGGKI